jgi:16S rRNA (cytidine1402-2'-O)-methyltransferase
MDQYSERPADVTARHAGEEREMGTLYLVATPIGNLEDITLRALRVLAEARLIAAEDTRIARRLLQHYDISTPLLSFHDDSPEGRAREIIAALEAGDVAVISDAGTPGISDPGSRLVRLAVKAGCPVIPIPGPSSVSAAAAASGLADEGYIFAGFLPRSDGARRERLRALSSLGLPIILFEAPTRARGLLETLAGLFPDAEVVIGREITKLHEEWLRGRPAELVEHLTERGEFTIVFRPNVAANREASVDLDALLHEALAGTTTLRDAVDQVIAATGLPRRSVYQRALELRG